jgi:hypothetical protein
MPRTTTVANQISFNPYFWDYFFGILVRQFTQWDASLCLLEYALECDCTLIWPFLTSLSFLDSVARIFRILGKSTGRSQFDDTNLSVVCHSEFPTKLHTCSTLSSNSFL